MNLTELTLASSGATTLVNLDNLLCSNPQEAGGIPIVGEKKPPATTKLTFTGGAFVVVKETTAEIVAKFNKKNK